MYHFVGLKGTGMSSLAQIMNELGIASLQSCGTPCLCDFTKGLINTEKTQPQLKVIFFNRAIV